MVAAAPSSSKKEVQYKIILTVSIIYASYYGATRVFPYLYHIIILSREKNDTLKRIKSKLEESKKHEQIGDGDGDGDNCGLPKSGYFEDFLRRFVPSFHLNVKKRSDHRGVDRVDDGVVGGGDKPLSSTPATYSPNPYQLKVQHQASAAKREAMSSSSSSMGATALSPPSTQKSYKESRPSDISTYRSRDMDNDNNKTAQDTIVVQQNRDYMKSLREDREKELKKNTAAAKSHSESAKREHFYERKKQLQEIVKVNAAKNNNSNSSSNSSSATDSIVVRFNIRSEGSGTPAPAAGSAGTATPTTKVTKNLAITSTIDDVLDCVEALPELPYYTFIEVSAAYPRVVLQRSNEGGMSYLSDIIGSSTRSAVLHIHTIDESEQ